MSNNYPETYFRNYTVDLGMVEGDNILNFHKETFSISNGATTFTVDETIDSTYPALAYEIFTSGEKVLHYLDTEYNASGTSVVFTSGILTNGSTLEVQYWSQS